MTLTFSTCILIGAAILYIYYYNRIEKRGGSAGGLYLKHQDQISVERFISSQQSVKRSRVTSIKYVHKKRNKNKNLKDRNGLLHEEPHNCN